MLCSLRTRSPEKCRDHREMCHVYLEVLGVVVSAVGSPLIPIPVMFKVALLIAPVITTHEPPSRRGALSFEFSVRIQRGRRKGIGGYMAV